MHSSFFRPGSLSLSITLLLFVSTQVLSAATHQRAVTLKHQPCNSLHHHNSTMSSLGSEDHVAVETTEKHSPAPSESSSSVQRRSSQQPEDACSTAEEKGSPHPKSPEPSQPEEPQEPKVDYIITLKKNTTREQFDAYKQELLKQGSVIKHEYWSIILKGFAVGVRPSMLQTFQEDPQVLDIELDQKVHI